MEYITIKNLGLIYPTEAIYNNIKVITVGLDIPQLVECWYREFNLFDKKVTLRFTDKKVWDGVHQKTLYSHKTVVNLFEEYGVLCEYIGETNND